MRTFWAWLHASAYAFMTLPYRSETKLDQENIVSAANCLRSAVRSTELRSLPEHGVLEARHLRASLLDDGAVEGCDHYAIAIGLLADDRAPRIGDQRVAEALALLVVLAPLCGGDDVGLIFDGARAQQEVPVRGTRVCRERG